MRRGADSPKFSVMCYFVLAESQVNAVEFGQRSTGLAKALEGDLIAKLTNFVASPIQYSVKRLLAADMKVMYSGNSG